jgi:ABC-type Fe3+/spermidine/putrescine transport system ATPase subunit
MASVSLFSVSKRFGRMAAMADVSLEIPSGSFLTLLGPSGCGKTTTLRSVAGLVEPDTGRIAIGGEDVTRLPVHRRDLAMVFQSHALFPHMRVLDNVAFGLRMRGRDRADRHAAARRALELVRLAEFAERWPHELSGGQQQRVALARALVVDPRVLLLDEPFGALDRKLREAMQAELRELTRRLGITAIFVTHDQEEALLLSDRIAVMNAGRIEQLGTPAEIYEAPATRFVASFMGVDNILECDLRGGAAAIGGVLHAVAGATGDGAAAIGLRPERIGLEPPGNGIAARVVAAVYLGAFSSYRCRLEGCGTELVVRAPNPQGAVTGPRFVAGEAVALTIAPGGLRALRA